MQGRDKAKLLTLVTLLQALSVFPDPDLFLLVLWLSKQKVSLVILCHVATMHRYPFVYRESHKIEETWKAAAKG